MAAECVVVMGTRNSVSVCRSEGNRLGARLLVSRGRVEACATYRTVATLRLPSGPCACAGVHYEQTVRGPPPLGVPISRVFTAKCHESDSVRGHLPDRNVDHVTVPCISCACAGVHYEQTDGRPPSLGVPTSRVFTVKCHESDSR